MTFIIAPNTFRAILEFPLTKLDAMETTTRPPLFPAWLETLTWRDATLTFEALEPAHLPPYLGSTLRGALGHLLRVALCDKDAGCGHECQQPAACRYFSLFERNRTPDGQTLPKSFLLLPPSLPGLDDIASGGPVTRPFQSGPPKPGESIPTLRCEAGWKVDPGTPLAFGLRLFGVAANVLPAIIEGVARFGLTIGTAPFQLTGVRDHRGQALYSRRWTQNIPVQPPPLQRFAIDHEPASRVRLLFQSPTVYKPRSAKVPTFDVAPLAAGFFEHCIGRAKDVVQLSSPALPSAAPLAWVDTPKLDFEITGHRLFHYELPRHSFRQNKSPDYDGVIGHIDLAGDFGTVMPWARAAEILHYGERSTSGLGKVRVLVLE